MDFLSLWLILFAGMINLMAWDNLWWIIKIPIPKTLNDIVKRITGKDAYMGNIALDDFKKMTLKEKINLIVFQRYIQVLINPLDLGACITGSFIFTLILKSLGVFL